MVLEQVRHYVDRIFGQTHDQKLKRLYPLLDEVNAWADEIGALSDEALVAKTPEFKERLAAGESTDDLMSEAFAVVREVAERTVGLRPYDVQVIGAIALHQRRIAEMKTGEGKTLVATMPVYLNALVGHVHLVTVNDYLAQRDREWMGPIYETLGLSVGLIQESMSTEDRKAAYQCDIIYGTNTQFGFDYLRDNLAMSWDQRVQTGLDYAIIDEIDNILIDEARTPLIISGSTEESQKLYKQFARLAPKFKVDEDFELDEKSKQIHMNDAGIARAEELLGVENLYNPQNIEYLHHLELALRAKHHYLKDTDYIVQNGRVVLVDQFTGRLMPDRQLSEGLHQAIEAKEGLEIRRESQTLAQVTLQHLFQLYDGLAGMTGTAATEEEEFQDIYGLDVIVVPTNEPVVRDDLSDSLYKTQKEKFQAIADDIEARHEQGQPILIGTTSIEDSERLSGMLNRRGLQHEVLNAKHHAREAEIIKDAGQRDAITVATNMAGRGVDIKLDEGVAQVGGLHVIGAQRHESRRIDDQLRGRSGRQGDPGSSQFYVSLEDDLLRLFGEQRMIQWAMSSLDEGQSLEHGMLNKAIRTAQQKVESYNFSIRKRLLDFDAVMASQREAIYGLRDRFIFGREDAEAIEADLEDYFQEVIESYTDSLLARHCPDEGRPHEWDLDGLNSELETFQNVQLEREFGEGEKYDEIRERVVEFLEANYRAQRERLGEHFTGIARYMILNLIDDAWRPHLYALDDLRDGIGWRSYQGRDPLTEFRREAFNLFQEMLARVEDQVISYLVKPTLQVEAVQAPTGERPSLQVSGLEYQHQETSAVSVAQQQAQAQGQATSSDGEGTVHQEPRRVEHKVGRNDPCPCGSGKKYKHCCGKNA